MPSSTTFTEFSPQNHALTPVPKTGLVLMGGGARAAYQVGVLATVVRLLSEAGYLAQVRNPFPIVVGTSAGALNAAAYASGADQPLAAVEQLQSLWASLHADRVYRTDMASVSRRGAHWLSMFAFGWLIRRAPRSLLDNSPLASLLQSMVRWDAIARHLDHDVLQALAITASSYGTGQHVTFYEARRELAPWYRTQRLAVPCQIRCEHLLASSAIPFVFPAVRLPIGDDADWFGDGSMRQSSPISPAIHLGADKVLVIGVGQLEQGSLARRPAIANHRYPSLAQIAGHAMASLFLDGLANDIERLQRVNNTVSLLSDEALGRTGLRSLEVLVISPSQRLDQLAARHLRELPRSMRWLLRSLGGAERRGAAMTSYLLFEPGFVGELLALGERDTLAKRDAVLRFFQV